MPLILGEYIYSANIITMRVKTTMLTSEIPTFGIDPSSTDRTGMARSPFIDRGKTDSILGQFVFHQCPDSTEGPLVDLLVGFPSLIVSLADMGGVSINHRRDSLCPAGLDKMPGYLVLGVFYPVIDFLEFSSLSLEKFSFPMAVLLLSVEFSMKRSLYLLSVLLLGAEEPAVIDGSTLPVEGGDGMDLPGVNGNSLAIQGSALGFMFDHQSEVVAIIPDDLSYSRLGKYFAFGDGNNGRGIPIAAGKLNMSVSEMDSRTLEVGTEVFGPSQRGLGFGVSLLILEVTLERGGVLLNSCLCGLRMKLVGLNNTILCANRPRNLSLHSTKEV